MVLLSPAPNTLGLASPAIGPWFLDPANEPPTLSIPLPDADLACPLILTGAIEWHAAAGGLASWHIVADPRQRPLAGLRKADGTPAFATGATVVLHRLLPEVAERLAALTSVVPRPEGGALPSAPTPARPRLACLALEIAPGVLSTADTLSLFGPVYPSDISTDADKATYIGLALSGGTLANAETPAAILARPGMDDRVILKNRPGGALSVKLWAFDRRGRPLDAGSVAVMLNFMAQTAQWENLFASTNPAEQRTAAAATGRIVHLVSAHEGPIAADLGGRIQTTGLTALDANNRLFQLGASAAITLSAAPADPDTDTAPVARLAPLPLGPYAPIATATPFAAWIGGAHPIARDFLRVAVVEVEAHLTGQTRAGNATNPQQDPRRRVTAFPNTAAAPVHLTTDAATTAAMAVLGAGNATLMVPELDADWGAQTPPALPATLLADVNDPALTVRAIAGSGTAAGGTVTGQSVAVHFDRTLPAGAWVRLWTHGRDTTTGRRFRQTGAAGLADAQGEALLVLPLPDGTAGAADGSVTLSADLLIVTGSDDRVYTDIRFARPPLAGGAVLSLPADGSTPAGVTLWVPEQGVPLTRGAGALAAGQRLLAVAGTLAAGACQLVDPASVLPADRTAASLPNAAAATDTLVTVTPAFGQTPAGSLPVAAVPGGPARVHRARGGAPFVTTFGAPGPSQERAELLAHEPGGNTGLIGATPGRAPWHEAPPARLGHPGVTAAPEIHGEGVSFAGPAADALRPLADERGAADLQTFLTRAAAPVTPAAAPTGASVWTAALETLASGMAGDAVFRAMAGVFPNFQPGQSWTTLKGRIDTALSSLGLGTLDSLIDTSTFDDDALAAAVDRVLWKTGSGVQGFARAAQAAIARAEDFVYLQTPAIDTQSANAGSIDLIGALETRLDARPGLSVVLCVAEGWLPDRTAKLEAIRTAGVKAALKRLADAAGDRVVLFSPIAGVGRKLHLAATTVVVDDAVLLTGTAHLWRRGLTFDSALSAALFDDTLADGRPAQVAAARVQLIEQMLGLRAGLLPVAPEHCVAALKALNAGDGFGRVAPTAYPAAPDTTTPADHLIWNPDGTPPVDWAALLAALTAAASSDPGNAIR
ncbi:hypothetical protein LHP98_10605 [Rhodobacter sp. Har01]|uniref:hypothetical protein n=1 Tax=Rhodobacter sp. Har01 TaxID=2883999 RepID=UPI001D0853E2|nr:hypothetical protein [Rhodobacter sp. Har01]MCB6178581.1 hypothetical protein [Rhodobacter sp. Har01]